jgi:hypothetical protein
MSPLKIPRPRSASEHGFTLAELSVTMFAGIVVIGALFSIMIVTLRQTQRDFTKVDATRAARTALANIENELHSGCVDGPSAQPIQGVTNGVIESDANDLVFLSYYGTSSSPTPVWHKLAFNASAGTLTDYAYTVTGTAPDWVQGTLSSTTTLLTNVAQISSTTPVFQYYAYEPEYTDASGSQYMLIPDGTNAVPGTGAMPNSPLATSSGLSASDSDDTVEVVINLLVGAKVGTSNSSTLTDANNPSLTGVNDPVTDAVSLRLTSPPNYLAAGISTANYGPCQ